MPGLTLAKSRKWAPPRVLMSMSTTRPSISAVMVGIARIERPIGQADGSRPANQALGVHEPAPPAHVGDGRFLEGIGRLRPRDLDQRDDRVRTLARTGVAGKGVQPGEELPIRPIRQLARRLIGNGCRKIAQGVQQALVHIRHAARGKQLETGDLYGRLLGTK